MSNDLNSCSFIGRLGKDPEVRYAPSGDAIASFSIAVGSQWKDKNGEKQEATEWVNVTAFGKLGEICGEYLKKGSQIFLSGRMKTEKWQDKDGHDRYSTKIIADKMQMLGSKSEHQAKREYDSNPPGMLGGQPAPAKTSGAFDDLEDDIPF